MIEQETIDILVLLGFKEVNTKFQLILIHIIDDLKKYVFCKLSHSYPPKYFLQINTVSRISENPKSYIKPQTNVLISEIEIEIFKEKLLMIFRGDLRDLKLLSIL